jgi:hypothetical protein
MKTMLKCMIMMVLAMSFALTTSAQEALASNGNGNPTVETKPATQKEVTLQLKNTAEKRVSVFVGPREEYNNPKITGLGGLSTNTFYVKEGDVVCIMDENNKSKACTIVKPNITLIQINKSASGFIAQQ